MRRAPGLGVLCLVAVAIAPAAAQAPGREAGAAVSSDRPFTLGDLEAAAARSPDDVRTLVVLGIAYLDAQNFPRAIDTLQRAVRVGPESAEAQNWLGVALSSGISDLPAAIAAFRKAVALDPKYGRAWSNLGSALAQSGDYAEAVDVFEKALGLEPNSAGAHLNLGMALRETGNLDRALEHLRKVVADEPGNAVMQYELGQTLRQNGDLAGAVQGFEKALELDSERREAYYALGAALKQQSAARRTARAPEASPADDLHERARDAAGRGDLTAAREELTRALALDEQHAASHTLLGFVLGQQGDLASALGHLERAVALRPESSEARYNLGVALWYSGSRERALTELRESVKADPAAGGAHAFLGTALRDSGDLAGSRASLQRAIALSPSTAATYVDLGITFLRLGDLDRAVGQFEAALNLPVPSGPEPDWQAAIADLRQALTSSADRADAHNVLGLLLGRKGAGSAEVIASFRAAVHLRPDYAVAHNNLGLVLIQAGHDEDGIAALREAVRLAPDYADARTNLGAALTPTDVDAAVRELEEAVRLAPGSVKAQFNLAVAYGASPRHGTAREIEHLRRVVELAPEFARARIALGKALLGSGDVAHAVAELEAAVRLEPTSGEANYQLGLALARAGRREEAEAQLRKGRELVAADDRRQTAALDIAEGRAALDRGDLDAAVARFRTAIKLLPDSFDAHRHLGATLERQGETAGASAAYRRALELNPGDAAARESLDRLTPPGPVRPSAVTTSGAGISNVDDTVRVAELEGYIREGKYQEVEPLLAAYVKERPQSSWGWYALGYTCFAQQKIGDSIKALSKSLQLDIRNAEAHKILGRNLMIIGRFDAAQVEFEQAIRYKPDSAESHFNLGKLFSIQDNWGPARRAFEAAVRIDPAYMEALDALGFTLEALGDDEGAIAMYEKAIALNAQRGGRFAAAHVNMSAYYNRTGDFARALEYARQALQLDDGSDRAWFQKAKADEREGRLEDAAEALNRAIVINPRASSYYYVLAGVYRKLEWMDESRKALEAFKRLERESNDLEKLRRRAASEALPRVPKQ